MKIGLSPPFDAAAVGHQQANVIGAAEEQVLHDPNGGEGGVGSHCMNESAPRQVYMDAYHSKDKRQGGQGGTEEPNNERDTPAHHSSLFRYTPYIIHIPVTLKKTNKKKQQHGAAPRGRPERNKMHRRTRSSGQAKPNQIQCTTPRAAAYLWGRLAVSGHNGRTLRRPQRMPCLFSAPVYRGRHRFHRRRAYAGAVVPPHSHLRRGEAHSGAIGPSHFVRADRDCGFFLKSWISFEVERRRVRSRYSLRVISF